jgi:PBSX family phage terminase large subunit
MEFQKWGRKAIDFICIPPAEDAFITILEGSVRSGKTVSMIPKWINYIMTGPPGLLLMTGVSKDTVYDNVLNDLFDTLGDNHYKYNRQSGELDVFWESKGGACSRRIKVVGAKDEGSEKFIRGKTLAGAYCDELTLMPEHFFKQLLNRLSVKGAKLYGTTNPDSPMHYLYKEYITNDAMIRDGVVKDIHFMLDDNPNLPDEYKANIRRSYSGMWYKRMILGMWVLAEGLIYDMVSDAMLYTDDELNKTMRSRCRRYIAVDYGTKNPMVFLDILDDGETVWVDREYYWDSRAMQRQKTDAQYADDLVDFIGDEYPDFIIIDPSAASFKLVCQGKGFRVKDADNSVNDGIRVTAMLISQGRLKVNRKCTSTLAEFQTYVWDEKAAANGKEQPLKVNDHSMDALRYYCKTMVAKWRLRE